MTTASIIQAIGSALALPASSSEIICVAAAPVAIWLKPVSPDAAPAAFQNPGNVGILLYHSSTWVGTASTLTIDNLNVGPIG